MEDKTIHMTQTGKPCAHCLRKGGPCHMHSKFQTPKYRKSTTLRTAAPKHLKSTSRHSRETAVTPPVDWIKSLPQPALYNVLLHMEPASLNAACRVNHRTAEICRLARFQQEYEALHRMRHGLFRGDLRHVLNMKDPGPFADEGKIFEDDFGNRVSITYLTSLRDRKGHIETITYTPARQDYGPGDTRGEMQIHLERTVDRTWEPRIWRFPDTGTQQEMIAFLQHINRTQWYLGRRGMSNSRGRKREISNSIIAEIKPYIVDMFPELDELNW